MRKLLPTVVFALYLLASPTRAAATSAAEIETIYGEWLQHYADRQPELAIAMTSTDFTMVYNELVMDRDAALAFTQGLAGFILSRQCTNHVVTNRALHDGSRLLLSRVDCAFQTVAGPLAGHFLESIVVGEGKKILYDHFTDVTAP